MTNQQDDLLLETTMNPIDDSELLEIDGGFCIDLWFVRVHACTDEFFA